MPNTTLTLNAILKAQHSAIPIQANTPKDIHAHDNNNNKAPINFFINITPIHYKILL